MSYGKTLTANSVSRQYRNGTIVTLITILAIVSFGRLVAPIPNPAVIYLTVVVYNTFRGGMGPGFISAAITLLYAMYFFSISGHVFQYTPDNMKRVIVLFFATPAITYMAGMLKLRSDRALHERDKLIADLQKAFTEIKTLHGILPICSVCKKIRDDKDSWKQMEAYISDHSEASFTHGYCPECAKKALEEVDEFIKKKNKP